MAAGDTYTGLSGWIGPTNGVGVPASAAGVRTVRVDPSEQYVGAGYAEEFTALPPMPDELTQAFGADVYERMEESDGVISSSVRTARGAAVGTTGPTLTPRYPEPSGAAVDWRDPQPGVKPDVVASAKALEFCRWAFDRLQTPIGEVAWQLSRCFLLKDALAEKVYDVSTDFDGMARIVPIDVRGKHWRTWAFVVDRFNRVDSILVRADGGTGDYRRVPRDKFVVAGFARDYDGPTGTSAARPCHPWWKLKGQVPRLAYNFACLYSTLIPWIALGPGATTEVPLDAEGRPIPGAAPVRPERRAAALLPQLKSGAGVVVPHGAMVSKLESSQNALPFQQLVELADQQVVHAILGTFRATLPTDRNSQSDAAQSMNVSDIVKNLIRLAVASALLRDLAWDALARNWGPAFADAYCPLVSFGESERRNFAAASAGVAALVTAGVIRPSQYQAALRIVLGLELPEPPQEEIVAVPMPGAPPAEPAEPSPDPETAETA